MYKIVDGSAQLSVNSLDVIDTKEKLYEIIKIHLQKLFEGKSDDEKLFWTTYTYYYVNKDGLFLNSKLKDVWSPIYDVSVEKSDETSIEVIPYKIDGKKRLILNKLDLYISGAPRISPLEVLGWEENLDQKWKGKIWMRTGFTGWHAIHVPVDSELLFREIGDNI